MTKQITSLNPPAPEHHCLMLCTKWMVPLTKTPEGSRWSYRMTRPTITRMMSISVSSLCILSRNFGMFTISRHTLAIVPSNSVMVIPACFSALYLYEMLSTTLFTKGFASPKNLHSLAKKKKETRQNH